MKEFSLLVAGEAMHLTRAQLEAIMSHAAEVGGTIQLSAAGFGTVRIVDPDGTELLLRPDGHADRIG